MNDLTLLQDLYDSEINVSIWWNWDGGVEARIGNGIYNVETNWEDSALCDTVAEAVEWLKERAIELYPDSVFAKKRQDNDTENMLTILHSQKIKDLLLELIGPDEVNESDDINSYGSGWTAGANSKLHNLREAINDL